MLTQIYECKLTGTRVSVERIDSNSYKITKACGHKEIFTRRKLRAQYKHIKKSTPYYNPLLKSA